MSGKRLKNSISLFLVLFFFIAMFLAPKLSILATEDLNETTEGSNETNIEENLEEEPLVEEPLVEEEVIAQEVEEDVVASEKSASNEVKATTKQPKALVNFTYDNIEYELDTVTKTATIIDGGASEFEPNNGSDVVIPATFLYSGDTYTVTAIGDFAFNAGLVTSVDIPDTVTSIGRQAFMNCSLKTLVLSDNVTSISMYAFARNELTSVRLPSGLTTIEAAIFHANKLTSIDIPSTVTSIGFLAFDENQLESIDLPDGLTTLGPRAFSQNKLTEVVVPEGITTISDFAFSTNLLTNVTFLGDITSIGNAAFFDNQFDSYTIPETVTSLGNYAFLRNQLDSIILPSSVTTIGDAAFGDNPLNHIFIPHYADLDSTVNVLNSNSTLRSVDKFVVTMYALDHVTARYGDTVKSNYNWNTGDTYQVNVSTVYPEIKRFAAKLNPAGDNTDDITTVPWGTWGAPADEVLAKEASPIKWYQKSSTGPVLVGNGYDYVITGPGTYYATIDGVATLSDIVVTSKETIKPITPTKPGIVKPVTKTTPTKNSNTNTGDTDLSGLWYVSILSLVVLFTFRRKSTK